MIPVLASAQARAFDAFVAEQCSVPSLLSMENAGRAAAEVLHRRLDAERASESGRRKAPQRRVVIVCGTGNNGGDGLVVARQLLGHGHSVQVLLTGGREELSPDARTNFDAWRGLGGELRELGEAELPDAAGSLWTGAHLIVDALFGTGLSRPLSGRYRALVDSINATDVEVVSLDIPSGMNADSGAVMGAAVIEVMTRPIEVDRLEASLDAALANADAVVIGPGLGQDEVARRVVDHVVLGGHPGPKVLDADALNHFAQRAHELADAPGPCLLTPHPAELGRLLSVGAKEVEADRFAAVDRAIELTHKAVLLKGPHTLVGEASAPPWIISEGHPALASGGSGDVLAGIAGALIATLGPLRAGALGAFVHGRAARLWVEAHGGADRGLFARELADSVPRALASLLGG